MVADCQLYAPAAFTPRKYSWYSFLLDAESTYVLLLCDNVRSKRFPKLSISLPFCVLGEYVSCKRIFSVHFISICKMIFVLEHVKSEKLNILKVFNYEIFC